MKKPRSILALVLMSATLSLVGCGGSSSHQDLRDYIEEVKRRPAGKIAPLPPFIPYKSFSYSAMTMHSPFSPPVEIIERVVFGGSTGDVFPDKNREKEFLEEFNLISLSMVGSLQLGEVRWALIDDGQGGVHRVKEGNYLGKNHGRIVLTTERKLDLIEIVPNGIDSWVERPQLLQIVEKE